MGESHTLFRLVIFIGFILLFSSVAAQPWVFVGQPLPPDSAWGQFSTGIQNFPTFNNPFAQSFLAVTQLVNTSDGTYSAAHGCPTDAYWECLQSDDAEDSYLNLTYNNFQTFHVNMSKIEGMNEIVALVFTVSCIQFTAGQRFEVIVDSFGTDNSYIFSCPTASYSHVSITLHPVCPSLPADSYCIWTFDNISEVTIFLSPFPKQDCSPCNFISEVGRFSYVQMDIYTNSQPPCTGSLFSDVGCQFSRLIDSIGKALIWIFNAVVFLFQVIFWFVGMIGIFFGSLTSILNVPGAPPIVTGIIGILIIGALFFVAIVLMGKIRGTGNTG